MSLLLTCWIEPNHPLVKDPETNEQLARALGATAYASAATRTRRVGDDVFMDEVLRLESLIAPQDRNDVVAFLQQHNIRHALVETW